MHSAAEVSHTWTHAGLPADMCGPVTLPGVQPVTGHWLQVDSAYAGQMAERERILRDARDDVLWSAPGAEPAMQELLDMVLADLPDFGFEIREGRVTCPDRRVVEINRSDPLGTLARLIQCDLCLLDREGEQHVLKAAALCFPASWSLKDKANQPLLRIHRPVDGYAGDLARRVQRLFDGVKAGRPLWRFNRLSYANPDLFQPRREDDRRDLAEDRPWLRSERQTILRLPAYGWVLFAIHTYVVRAADVGLSDTG